MSLYFARCLRGLEGIAREEIVELTGARFSQEEIRTLFFTYEGPPTDLVKLRSIDDVFLSLGEIKELDHTRASLQKIELGIRNLKLDLSSSIKKIQAIRSLSLAPSFTLTVGLQGKKNFSRFELAQQVLPIFEEKLKGNYIPNEPGSRGAELDFRLLMEGNVLQMGLRLAKQPLHRRPYKLHNLPGSTKPPLAYAMARLLEIRPEDVVLDPCCGVGTLLIEAADLSPAKSYIGLDIKHNSIEFAEKNAQAHGQNIEFQLGDVRELPFSDASIDRILSNPPWGRQVSKEVDLNTFYHTFFLHTSRVLKKGGRMVLLTDQARWMEAFLASSSTLKSLQEMELSLFGSIVKIYVLEKG